MSKLFPKPFKLNRDWMDLAERKKFEQMKETGQISFFRTKPCAWPKCDKDVPKIEEKLYCSAECKTKALGKKTTKEVEAWQQYREE